MCGPSFPSMAASAGRRPTGPYHRGGAAGGRPPPACAGERPGRAGEEAGRVGHDGIVEARAEQCAPGGVAGDGAGDRVHGQRMSAEVHNFK
jgi:hypothetical protein